MKLITLFSLFAVLGLIWAEEHAQARLVTVRILGTNLDSETALDAVAEMKVASELFEKSEDIAIFFLKSFKIKNDGNWKIVVDKEAISDGELKYIKLNVKDDSINRVIESKPFIGRATTTKPTTKPTDPPKPAKETKFFIFSCNE